MADDPKIPPELIKRLMATHSEDEFHALVEAHSGAVWVESPGYDQATNLAAVST